MYLWYYIKLFKTCLCRHHCSTQAVFLQHTTYIYIYIYGIYIYVYICTYTGKSTQIYGNLEIFHRKQVTSSDAMGQNAVPCLEGKLFWEILWRRWEERRQSGCNASERMLEQSQHEIVKETSSWDKLTEISNPDFVNDLTQWWQWPLRGPGMGWSCRNRRGSLHQSIRCLSLTSFVYCLSTHLFVHLGINMYW